MKLAITWLCMFSLMPAIALAQNAANGERPPRVGDAAKDFTLTQLDGQPWTLSEALESGPVVLVVLRGYPGYQCPLCTAQVGSLVRAQSQFSERRAQVVMVYPGPNQELVLKAKEFMSDVELPKHFTLVTDPDYSFTQSYHLRWDAPRETAYPSTFVIGTDRKIQFAKVSRTHGDRAKVDQVLAAIK